MAKAISSEELQLKKRARRRLVGAIALVLIVVVFLPMLLDNEPRKMSQDISINIPAQNSPEALTPKPLRFQPVEPIEISERDAGPDDKEPARQEQAKPISAPPQVADSNQTGSRNASQANSTADGGGYVVQLGAFSNAGNANRLVSKVRENKFKAYTQVVSTSKGEHTRVRVGPYPTRAAAEDARERLKSRKLTFGEPTIVKRDE